MEWQIKVTQTLKAGIFKTVHSRHVVTINHSFMQVQMMLSDFIFDEHERSDNLVVVPFKCNVCQ